MTAQVKAAEHREPLVRIAKRTDISRGKSWAIRAAAIVLALLLGAAAGIIGILSPEQLRESIRNIFAAKGERVVEMNLKAFEIGREYGGRQ